MALTRVRIELDDTAINRVLRSPTGMVGRDMLRRGKRVEALAKIFVPVDTGWLRASITTKLVVKYGVPVAQVEAYARYARWVHEGTGIYGPRNRRIRPHGKVLVFVPKGQVNPVFAGAVKGQFPSKFLYRAMVTGAR